MSGSFEKAAILIKRMMGYYINMNKSKILIMGIGKEIDGEYQYETDLIDFIVELQEYGRPVHVIDFHADTEFLKEHYNINCKNNMGGFGVISTYSAIVFGVEQEEFRSEHFKIKEYMRGRCVLFDWQKPHIKY